MCPSRCVWGVNFIRVWSCRLLNVRAAKSGQRTPRREVAPVTRAPSRRGRRGTLRRSPGGTPEKHRGTSAADKRGSSLPHSPLQAHALRTRTLEPRPRKGSRRPLTLSCVPCSQSSPQKSANGSGASPAAANTTDVDLMPVIGICGQEKGAASSPGCCDVRGAAHCHPSMSSQSCVREVQGPRQRATASADTTAPSTTTPATSSLAASS